ncbi:hypothetical protein [Pelagibius sp. 7325]|uniref:hypothetical protein n=1 Tax=Pelagibius sp. 7325 TaxID=3131994 RepID=UPI0030EC6D24
MIPSALGRSPRLLLTAVLAGGLLFGLAACGKKGSPKPPEDQEDQYTYPQDYPAPSTVVPNGQAQPEENAGPLSIFNDDNRTKTKTY